MKKTITICGLTALLALGSTIPAATPVADAAPQTFSCRRGWHGYPIIAKNPGQAKQLERLGYTCVPI